MKKEMKKKNNKGFSLVELIVVIAIMAVLMVVLAPAMLRYVEKTRMQKDASAVSEAANAAELALADEKIYTQAASAKYVVVTVTDNTNITASTGSAITGGAGFVDLATDVKNTVGDKIDFASKEYENKTATIVLEYNDTRKAYILYNSGEYTNGVKWE